MKKKNNKIKFEIDKSILKLLGKVFLIGVLAFLIVFLFKWVLIPLLFNMIGILLKLVLIYQTLDPTSKFFGGFIFLFISWKIFEAFCSLVIFLINKAANEIQGIYNQLSCTAIKSEETK